MLDTKRESDIGLGTDWPFEALNAGECLLSDSYTGADIGDDITITVNLHYLIITMIEHYNSHIRAEGDKKISESDTYNFHITCTIVGTLSQSYGKFSKQQFINEIVMEYNQFFPYVASFLNEEMRGDTSFMKYLETEKILD